MRPRALAISVSIAAIAAQSPGLAAPALAAVPVNVPFAYTGTEQSWVVPAGLTSIHVVLVGGKGGSNATGEAAGGKAGEVSGDLAVNPADTIYIEVGGSGLNGSANSSCSQPAFNGGGLCGSRSAGYGGGASDLRSVSSAQPGSLASRLMLAAGGGGAGGGASSPPAIGGNAGQAGGDASGATTAAKAGQPGSSSAGGTGGAAGQLGGLSGADGQVGAGGDGGAPGSTGFGGGGGGGGYYGGGGGGGGDGSLPNGAGGGGGSSFVGAATSSSVTLDSSGVPSVTITYGSNPSGGSVDATVTMAQSAVCLELSTTSVDFGTRQFGDVAIAATPGVIATNCGGIGEDVLAHGSNATGAGPTSWTLDDTGTCTGGTLAADHFGLAIERQDTSAQVRLSGANKALETLTGGAAIDHLARIDTPCPGSSGAGVVMAMQMTFVATESVP
jgi:hypothetical protein